MISESARVTTAAEARFRINKPNSQPRVVHVVALDRPSEAVVVTLARGELESRVLLQVRRHRGGCRSLSRGDRSSRPRGDGGHGGRIRGGRIGDWRGLQPSSHYHDWAHPLRCRHAGGCSISIAGGVAAMDADAGDRQHWSTTSKTCCARCAPNPTLLRHAVFDWSTSRRRLIVGCSTLRLPQNMNFTPN